MEMLHDIFIDIRFNERRNLKASAKTWPPLNLNEKYGKHFLSNAYNVLAIYCRCACGFQNLVGTSL